jgi:predicted outer membrane repeat protein
LEQRCTPTTVSNLNDAGPGSLRQALLDTPAGGTVDFSPDLTGTIVLTTGELDIGKDLTIQGPGADVLKVSGNHRSSVFNIGSGNTVALSGLAVKDGALTSIGGGIVNDGTLTLTACTISGNSAFGELGYGHGGGIYNGSDGTLAVSDCAVSDNAATDGGGIYNAGTLRVSNSTFRDNSVFRGLFLIDSGGAICNASNSGPLVISQCTFSDNSATGAGFGGAIYNGVNNSTLIISDCTFSGNSASGSGFGGPGSGGAIAGEAMAPDTITITDCTFSGNSANGSGGAVFCLGCALTLTGSTVSGNSANRSGGGIYIDPFAQGMAALVNTIVAGNTAPSAPDVDGVFSSQGHNLIGQTDGSSGWVESDLTGTRADPLDPLLGPLHDNGGPTQTMALLPGSPALNAGDPGQLGAPDQRGVVRTGRVNIGAYQASATAFVVSAPGTVQADVPFDVTVTAVDPFGQVAVGYTGTVTFSTTDPDAGVVLPQDYTFQPVDNGVATFSGQTTLVTPGEQTIFVTDADGIMGSVTLTVV